MALSRTDRGTATGITSATSSSFTPAAGSILIAFTGVIANAIGPLSAPTVSGGSLQWNSIGTAYGNPSWAIRLDAWYAVVGGSPSAMTVGLSRTGSSAVELAVIEFSGQDTSTPIAGYVTSGSTDIGDGAETQTLAATPATADVSIAVIYSDCDGNPSNPTMSGWTKVYDFSYSAGYGQLVVERRESSTSTSVSVGDTYTATGTYYKGAMLSFIVKAAGASAYTVNVTDGTTVGESIAVSLPNNLTVSLSEGPVVGESVLVNATDTRMVQKNEDVTVGESVALSPLSPLAVSVAEGVTVGESASASIGSGASGSYSARTTASSDDAYAGSIINDSGRNVTTCAAGVLTGDVRIGSGTNNDEYCTGLRFLSVSVPGAATISAATLSLTPSITYNAGSNVIKAWVSAQAADNPTTFTTATNQFTTTNRPRTTATYAWTQTSVTKDQPESIDITNVIQEIVNRSGWVSGNAIVIILDCHADTTVAEWQDYYSYDTGAASAPQLAITYGSGAGPYTINVTDSLTVGESVPTPNISPLSVLSVNVTDDTGVTDSPTVSLPTLGALSINKTEGVTVADSPATSGPLSSSGLSSSHEVSVGNGYTDGTPNQMLYTSDERLWIASWQFDNYPQGPTSGLGQTLRMYKADQVRVPSSFSRLDSADEPVDVNAWSIGVDSADTIHVLWTVRASWAAGTGTDNVLNYTTFNTATGQWGTPTAIESSLGVTEIGQGDELLALAVDSSDVVHIVYLKSDGTRRRVTYRNNSGGSWSAPTTVDDQSFGANERCWHPGIFIDAAGRLAVVWERGAFNNDTTGRLFIRVYDGSWGTTHDITGYNVFVGIDQALHLYADNAGRYHLAYLNTSKNIYYRYSDDQGATWSENNPVSGTALGDDPTVGPHFGGKVRIYAHGDPTTYITYFQGVGGSASWETRANYSVASGYDCSVSIAWARARNTSTSLYAIAFWLANYPTNALYVGAEYQLTTAALLVAVSDGIGLGESRTLSVLAPAALTISVTDGASVGETPAVGALALKPISATEALALGETLSAAPLALPLAAQVQAVSLGESASAAALALAGINTIQAVSLGETASTSLSTALAINLSEGLTLGESASARLPGALALTVTDDTSPADLSPNVSLPEIGSVTISTADTANLGEDVTLEFLTLPTLGIAVEPANSQYWIPGIKVVGP